MNVEKKRKVAAISLVAGLLVAIAFGLLYYFMIQMEFKNKENIAGYAVEVKDNGESNYSYKSKHVVDGETVVLEGTSSKKVSVGDTIDAYRVSKGSKELTLKKPNPYASMCAFAIVAGVGALAFIGGIIGLMINKPRRNAKIGKKIKVSKDAMLNNK